MRKEKIVTIDDRKITVYELKAKHIRDLVQKLESLGNDTAPGALFAEIQELFPLATDLDPDGLWEMAPSEVQVLWDAFREVNAVFFGLLSRAGVSEALGAELRKLIQSALTEASASLSQEGTPSPGSTDGASS